MRIINDEKRLQSYLKETNILDNFTSKDLDFRLVSYEKGEILSSPYQPLNQLLFVLEGRLHIYAIREDGSFFSINNEGAGTFMGDMEFCKKDSNIYFNEALEPTLCIALPIEENRHILENDVAFLHFVLGHIVDRLEYFSKVDLPAQSLESKLLLYLREIEPSHEIKAITPLLSKLHCSRRQLQRVVSDLCERGELVKVKKGHYQLNK